MKNILLLLLLLSLSFKSYSFVEGKYLVDCDHFSLTIASYSQSKMTIGFKKGDKIDLYRNGLKVGLRSYKGLYFIGMKIPANYAYPELDRKFLRNTKITIHETEDWISQKQVTNSFEYRQRKDFCHPYDFTGVSCVFGMLNPMNWISKKRIYPKKELNVSLRKVENGLLFTADGVDPSYPQAIDQNCLLRKI